MGIFKKEPKKEPKVIQRFNLCELYMEELDNDEGLMFKGRFHNQLFKTEEKKERMINYLNEAIEMVKAMDWSKE